MNSWAAETFKKSTIQRSRCVQYIILRAGRFSTIYFNKLFDYLKDLYAGLEIAGSVNYAVRTCGTEIK